MTRDAVTGDQLPPSGLPFSVTVRGGGLRFLSGPAAPDPATGKSYGRQYGVAILRA